MEGRKLVTLSRRAFVTKVMPACALTCLAGGSALALGQTQEPAKEKPEHKFDEDSGKQLSHKQLNRIRYREFIEVTKALSEKMGKDELLAFLREYTNNKMLAIGKVHASQSPDDSFVTYVNTFKDPRYDQALTMKILEDTDKVFEIKVTECLWAVTFLEADAGDIGYASVCYGDYAWASGFNPKIGLIRDKTLMQGHDCCNHRYVWEA